MPTQRDPLSAAKKIIRHCLGLTEKQDLLLFVDETTLELGLVFAEAAHALKVPQMTVLVPVARQRDIRQPEDLCILIQGAARDARAILTCVNGAADCLPFRRQIIGLQRAQIKIGHMPGASFEVLRLANVNFERLVKDCHHIEMAMARGRRLELISYAADGAPHRLTADIGGWERLPVPSDGIIPEGGWGNVPSGETYIAPIEDSAEGSIVINGSIPGLVIAPGQEIVLRFREGRVVAIEPADSPAARWLREKEIQVARSRGDANWDRLAEIGIGVNGAVEQLTGNMLFDEKAAGTAHIAIGNNKAMGGNVNSIIHCDMVSRRPTIVIDGRTILERGVVRFVEAEWRENYRAVALEESPLRAARYVARTGSRAGESGGRLYRVLHCEAGRETNYFVGDEETTQYACCLYNAIPPQGDTIAVSRLVRACALDAETARRTLHLLWDYGLIRLASS